MIESSSTEASKIVSGAHSYHSALVLCSLFALLTLALWALSNEPNDICAARTVHSAGHFYTERLQVRFLKLRTYTCKYVSNINIK